MVDAGITFNFETLVADNEIMRMTRRILEGIPISDLTMAVDVIRKVGVQGHYLAEEHTAANFRSLHVIPELVDRANKEIWKLEGSKSMLDKAHEKVIKILETHKPEPLPDSVANKIKDLVDQAEKEF